jgi:glycosyltransferase involved in cell wall biosynthesis
MNPLAKRKKIIILYRYIPQYRIRFYELLRCRLAENNIDLLVIYGQPGSKDALKKDAVKYSDGIFKRSIILSIGRYELYWQPVLPLLKDADLIIIEQASKLLINYILIFLQILRIKKVAFWGHGENFQHKTANIFGERVKRLISTHVHWWFAYNNMSIQVLVKLGYSINRITNIQNSTDTRQIHEALMCLNKDDIDRLRRCLRIHGRHVGLYVGGMYKEKYLNFLLKACMIIHQQIPDFEMIFIGAGPDDHIVRKSQIKFEWIHYVGPKFNLDRVPYFAISQVFLMPGLVGLAILDCFALEVPLVTTQHSEHSPEINYLKNGFNGIMVNAEEDPNIYAQAIISLLNNEGSRKKLIQGCRNSYQQYSIEDMVHRFTAGIKQALQE